jgi:beta-lactamase class A
MNLNDIYESLATFWGRISPLLFAHLAGFLAIRWVTGIRINNILPRIESYLASDTYKRWKAIFSEVDLAPKIPYLLVIAFLIYLTLFNSLLIDSLTFRPVSIRYSELDFWEESRPLDEILTIGSYTKNPNIRFWEIALEKQRLMDAFRVRYPDRFASSVNWLVSDYGKWQTYYKCAILFLPFVLLLAAVQIYRKRDFSSKMFYRILTLLVLSALVIAFTRYRAEQLIERQLKAELVFVGTLLHVDPDAQKNRLNELQTAQLRRNLCLELSTRVTRPDRLFWWSRYLERYLPIARDFPAISNDEFKRLCGESQTGLSRGCPPSQLLDAVGKLASSLTRESVGAAFAVLETHEFASMEGRRRFGMQSMYQLPIAMMVLRQVDDGKLSLDQKIRIDPKDLVSVANFDTRKKYSPGAELSVRELLHLTVSESDGTASDVLLRLVGGPEQVTKYLRELGIEDLVIAKYEREVAANPHVADQNWATAESMIELLKLLQEGSAISETGRDLLLDLMLGSDQGATRIKGLLPPGSIVAHQPGTALTPNGIMSEVSEAAIITLPSGNHLFAAIFVSDPKADEHTRDEMIAKIAQTAWNCWVPAP